VERGIYSLGGFLEGRGIAGGERGGDRLVLLKKRSPGNDGGGGGFLTGQLLGK